MKKGRFGALFLHGILAYRLYRSAFDGMPCILCVSMAITI